MPDAARAIETYILAKDCNRPWLMQQAFAPDATLKMVVRTQTISFPPSAVGREAMSAVLVRQFALDHENVYTICLTTAPNGQMAEFECPFLVGMTRRRDGALLLGCGRYQWAFAVPGTGHVTGLQITLDLMLELSPEHDEAVFRWLAGLGYPWCGSGAALRDMPRLDKAQPVLEYLTKVRE